MLTVFISCLRECSPEYQAAFKGLPAQVKAQIEDTVLTADPGKRVQILQSSIFAQGYADALFRQKEG